MWEGEGDLGFRVLDLGFRVSRRESVMGGGGKWGRAGGAEGVFVLAFGLVRGYTSSTPMRLGAKSMLHKGFGDSMTVLESAVGEPR